MAGLFLQHNPEVSTYKCVIPGLVGLEDYFLTLQSPCQLEVGQHKHATALPGKSINITVTSCCLHTVCI